VAPYTIVAGNPARLIRKRFDDELIALLEAFKWWDKPLEEIQRLNDSDMNRVKRALEKAVPQ
jgi:virginiamycin A acetyltransferase